MRTFADFFPDNLTEPLASPEDFLEPFNLTEPSPSPAPEAEGDLRTRRDVPGPPTTAVPRSEYTFDRYCCQRKLLMDKQNS